MKLAILASHSGTTLQAILDACANGRLDGEVSVVISNNSQARALERARAVGVPTLHLSSKTHPDEAALDRAIRDALERSGAEVVFLAGYMKRLGPSTLSAFEGRILNTHPALLPKFGGVGMYGMNVHRAVLEAGEGVSGASVHLVNADYDAGKVLAQERVEVFSSDTAESLAERVQASERELVVDVLCRIARGDLRLGAR